MNESINETQQEFLRRAMATLKLNRQEMAGRIGTTKRRLDNWMLPNDSKGFRVIDEIAVAYINEILSNTKS